MQWDGEGLIIGVRRHGETSVIAEVMVAGRGRMLGLIRGGRSIKLAATLQAGNSVQLTWRARLEEHLGTFTLELIDARAAGLIADRTRLYASQLLCEHLRLLPERDPHDRLLGMAVGSARLGRQRRGSWASALARFELVAARRAGVRARPHELRRDRHDGELTHVSPKTGPGREPAAAEPYRDRLLRLPGFLIGDGEPTPADSVPMPCADRALSRHACLDGATDRPAGDARRAGRAGDRLN